MRRIFWLSVLIYALVLIVLAVYLPARVPAHFGASGDVDRWSSRTEFVVVMTAVGGGLTLLFAFFARLIAMVDVRSSWTNIPYKKWWTATAEREGRVRRMLADDLFGIAAATMLFVSLILVAALRASHLDEPRLGSATWILLAVYLVGLGGWIAWIYAARYRPQEES